MAATLTLYSSMERELVPFESIRPNIVHLYTCGPTVYAYQHLGNLRAYVFTDTLRRTLQWKGYDVLHVMNITDVGHLTSDEDEGEDKMEKAARAEKRSVWEIAEHYASDFRESLEALRVLPPSVWPKATDHIQEMIAFAARLERAGYTYEIEDGLYFDTSKVADYGRLARASREGQEAGRRVSADDKRSPEDFAVWRRSPESSNRLMEWTSPWGVGAPGWHLECSVMSIKYLDAPFDIHTGGVDHRQVHHCNEIAQNQAFLDTDDSGVRYWLHNEFLISEMEKMSKSRGKILRLQNLVSWGIHPLVYRYFLLMSHYRQQVEFSFDALVAAHTGLTRLVSRIEELRRDADADWARPFREVRFSRGASFAPAIRGALGDLDETSPWITEFDEAISADLNTGKALALLSKVATTNELSVDERLRLIAIYDLALGLDLLDTSVRDLDLRPEHVTESSDDIDARLDERQRAREEKLFADADRIRDELEAIGVTILDSAAGSSWHWTPQRPTTPAD